MRLGISPIAFFARALVAFVVTYALWQPIASFYTGLLSALIQGFLKLTEISSDPNLHQVSQVWSEGTGVFFKHRLFPQIRPPGIPAEWVQANLVLLIPLMVATPAATWRQKAVRMLVALAIAIAMQVIDVTITIKSFYASQLGPYSLKYYGDTARWLYQFSDAFAQAMDTQLFPFVIWAGIHFRSLLGARITQQLPTPSRQERRRSEKQRAEK